MVREALGGSGMPWDQCQYEDRGDGVVVIFPPDMGGAAHRRRVSERLRGPVRRHNRFSCESARMQLRMAVNVGPVYRDEHGADGYRSLRLPGVASQPDGTVG